MSGNEALAALRSELSQTRATRKGCGWAYSQEVRSRALEYVGRRRAEGIAVTRIAVELGIPHQTLEYWLNGRKPKPVLVKGALLPVTLDGEVVEPVERVSAPGAWVVHGPGGLRIEGLDVAALAELIRRLA
jgi:transposase